MDARPSSASMQCLVIAGLALTACRSAFEFGVLGDAPYVSADEARFARLIEDLNRSPLAFVVHVGDMQGPPELSDPGGTPTCTDASLAARKALFDASRHPFVLTPGDNDWTDCHLADCDPLERLARLRAVFFADARSLGRERMPMEVQATLPGYEPYVENRAWSHAGVEFATLHLVGSHDGFGHDATLDAEARAREAADLAWMARAFARARATHARAVVLFTQADPLFELDWNADQRERYLLGLDVRDRDPASTDFATFRAALRREVESLPVPVLLVHGDSHTFRLDKPLTRAEDGSVLENFTRLETFGYPDVHGVRVRVDPDDPDVFAVRPLTMGR